MNRYVVLAGASALLFLSSGCAFIPDTTHVNYASAMRAVKLPGAENVSVRVTVFDARRTPDRVGVKKNGFGLELAPIQDPEVVGTVKHAVESELAVRGFKLGQGNVVVSLQLNKFFNDFKTGIFTWDARSELVMDVQVKGADGSIRFARSVVSEGANPNILVGGGEEARVALEEALRSGMAQLFSNKEFIDALSQPVGAPPGV